MKDDITLIKKYLSGDEDAVEELVMKYQKQIYAFVYKMTNDIEEAKDLTQETFVRAIKGIKGFRMEASFKTWLYRIALNTNLNQVRQKKYKEIELEKSTIGNQTGALSSIIEKEKEDYIKKGLNELPERQRLAVILRAYEGLSCNEAAKVMECSEGAVKAHYHNAVKRLREILSASSDSPRRKGEGL